VRKHVPRKPERSFVGLVHDAMMTGSVELRKAVDYRYRASAMSQERLAHDAGLDRTLCQRCRAGDLCRIGVHAEALAGALGVRASDLIDEEYEPVDE